MRGSWRRGGSREVVSGVAPGDECMAGDARARDARRVFMSGNEAIARGAYEAGVGVACGFPGTPSTEIVERLREFDGMYVEWSPNEKVALEVALGAAIAGVRALAAMKHVGLNVAADPLLTAAYTGVNAGLVVVSADDPGMHSSQNEQDNRHYARLAKIPMLEPSDSQEAKDLVGLAFDMSERFDTPVMIRTTTRISHSSGIVLIDPPRARLHRAYEKRPPKYVMVPGNARVRRTEVEARLKALAEFAEGFSGNVIQWNRSRVGVVASGVAYQYAREVLGKNVSYLKISLTFPIPKATVIEFASRVDRLYVIEELDPFIEDQIRAMGLDAIGKGRLPVVGELSPEIVRKAMIEEGVISCSQEGMDDEVALVPAVSFGVATPASGTPVDSVEEGEESDEVVVPARPPVMCPGCPHRGAFYALKKLGTVATGDIGCYTLGAGPPLHALDTTICMGASIGNAIGFSAAAGLAKETANLESETADPATKETTIHARDETSFAEEPADPARETQAPGVLAALGANKSGGGTGPAGVRQKPVAVIGDSTFVHSGITGLIDAVYNDAHIVVFVLDNGTTAMTGHQDHPATGVTLRGKHTHKLRLEDISRACGVESVAVVDPYDLTATEMALREAMSAPGPAVVIARRPCVLLPRAVSGSNFPGNSYRISEDRCTACRFCLGLGCPAIEIRDGRPRILEALCAGCGVCAQVCRRDAIVLRKAGESGE